MVEVNSGSSSTSTSLEILGRRPLDGRLVELTGVFDADDQDDDMHVGARSLASYAVPCASPWLQADRTFHTHEPVD